MASTKNNTSEVLVNSYGSKDLLCDPYLQVKVKLNQQLVVKSS